MIHSRQTLPNIASKRNMICSVPLCNVSRLASNDLDSPGQRLKWAREKAGFQQAGDFAKRVGVHPTRSEERRVGRVCVSTCRSRWSSYHLQNNHVLHHVIKILHSNT